MISIVHGMQLRYRDARAAQGDLPRLELTSVDFESDSSSDEYQGELDDVLGKQPVHWR